MPIDAETAPRAVRIPKPGGGATQPAEGEAKELGGNPPPEFLAQKPAASSHEVLENLGDEHHGGRTSQVIAALDAEVSDLQTKLQKATREAASEKLNARNAQAEYTRLTAGTAALQQRHDDVARKASGFESANRVLETTNRTLDTKLAEAERLKKDAESKLAEAVRLKDEAVQKASDAEGGERLAKVDLKKVQGELTTLQAQSRTLETEKNQLAADKLTLTAEKQTAETTARTLQAQNVTLTTEKAALVTAKTAAETAKATAETERDGALTKLAGAEKKKFGCWGIIVAAVVAAILGGITMLVTCLILHGLGWPPFRETAPAPVVSAPTSAPASTEKPMIFLDDAQRKRLEDLSK